MYDCSISCYSARSIEAKGPDTACTYIGRLPNQLVTSSHYGALRRRDRLFLPYDIRSIAVGRLDESIPITAAIETVALSWSSICNRLDLYAPLNNRSQTPNTEPLGVTARKINGAAEFVHSNRVGFLLELQLSHLSNTTTLSDGCSWGGPLRYKSATQTPLTELAPCAPKPLVSFAHWNQNDALDLGMKGRFSNPYIKSNVPHGSTK